MRPEVYTTRLSSVPGWLSVEDALLIARVSREQYAHGDLLEIGAYYGRSAILLGMLLRDGERLVVCDTFRGSGSLWPGLSRSAFETNYLRYHTTLPEIRECESRELDELVGSFRLLHVDGSHLQEDAECDLRLARTLAAPGAVIVVSDLHGVTPAAEGLQLTRRTADKLYFRSNFPRQ